MLGTTPVQMEVPAFLQVAVGMILAGVSGLVVFAFRIEQRVSTIEGFMRGQESRDARNDRKRGY